MAFVMVTSVAAPVVGAVVLGAIVIGIIKLFWSAGESVIESAQVESDGADMHNTFLKWKRKSFADFDVFIREKFKIATDADVTNVVINSEGIANEIIEKIESLIWIEIYDNRILMGRKVGDIKNLLNLQLDRYDKWGSK